jgi:hypothetical protein
LEDGAHLADEGQQDGEDGCPAHDAGIKDAVRATAPVTSE